MVQALAKQGIFQQIVEVSTFNHRYVMFFIAICFVLTSIYMLRKTMFSTNVAQDQQNIGKTFTVLAWSNRYSTFQKSDTNYFILIQPYFGLMKVRAIRSILQPNLIFKGAFGGL